MKNNKTDKVDSIAYHNWLGAFARILRVRTPLSELLVGVILYAVAVISAVLSGEFQSVWSFAAEYPGVHLAIAGITFVLVGFSVGIPWIMRVADKLKVCVDMPEEKYGRLLRSSAITIFSNKMSILFGVMWSVFILWRAYVHYPTPIPAFTTQPFIQHPYALVDWYILGIFVIVMMFLGSGIWMIVGALICFRRLKAIPLRIDKIDALSPLITVLLAATFAWFICVSLSAPVLVLFSPIESEAIATRIPIPATWPILAIQLAFGFSLFFVPQFWLQSVIRNAKRNALQNLRPAFYQLQGELKSCLSNPEGYENRLLRCSTTLISIDTVMRRVEGTREWFLGLNTLTQLAFSTAIPIVVNIFLTR